jgi:uncharacterized iron-regulated membrane protein
MSFVRAWLRRPQNTWLRRALFQIHLWTGIGVGLYVLAISISGSAIVFRNEIYGAYSPNPTVVDTSGPRLTKEQLKEAAHRRWPGYLVTFIWEARRPNQAIEIWMERKGKQKQRLFDPYSGKDLGPAVPNLIRTVAWLSDFHTNLLGGQRGRIVNGVGSILLTILALTGMVIWWPGAKTWRRAMTIQWKANWKRINFDLHSAVGFWTFALIFMWALTGIYVVWPTPFQKAINRFYPLEFYRLVTEAAAPTPTLSGALSGAKLIAVADELPPPPRRRRVRRPPHYSTGDKIVRWLTYLHFGNFAGPKTKALWVVLGLAPVALFITGVMMWWNRVLSREARRARRRSEAAPVVQQV